MRKFIVAGFILLGIAQVNAKDVQLFNQQADSFFKLHVANGRVDYKNISHKLSEISSLYNEIGIMNLSSASAAEKKAFYINAYNLIVIYQVAKYYPLSSPLDQSGFFDKVKHQVAGESLTLNHLEIKKLLLTYKDPRIHFALACAAQSCPPLASFAYEPDKLDQQLDIRAKVALNDKDWLKVNSSENKVLLSKIFDWYKKDFAATGMSLIEWINQYRVNKIPSSYNVGYYEYNWALNER